MRTIELKADNGDVQFEPLYPMTAEQEENHEKLLAALEILTAMSGRRSLSHSMWSDENYKARMELKKKATPCYKPTRLTAFMLDSAKVSASSSSLISHQQQAGYILPHLRPAVQPTSSPTPTPTPTSPLRLSAAAAAFVPRSPPSFPLQGTAAPRLSATASAFSPRSPSQPPPSSPCLSAAASAFTPLSPAAFVPSIPSTTTNTQPPTTGYVLPHLRRRPDTTTLCAKSATDKPAEVAVEPHLQAPRVGSEKFAVVVEPAPYVLPHLRRAGNTTALQTSPEKSAETTSTTPFQAAPPQTAPFQATPSHVVECAALPNNAIISVTSVTPDKPAATSPVDTKKDEFMEWMSKKNALPKIVTKIERAPSVVAVKTRDMPSYQVQPPAADYQKPADSSASKDTSAEVKMSPSQEREAAEVAAFLDHISNGDKLKNYGGPKQQTPPKPTPLHNMSARLNNPFANKKFHLKEDSIQKFQEFLEAGAAAPTSGKKWTNAAVVNAQQVHPITNWFEAPITQNAASVVQTRPVGLAENKKPVDQVGQMGPQAISNPNSKAPNGSTHLAGTGTAKPAGWATPIKAMAAKICSDIKSQPPIVVEDAHPLTKDALIKTTGFKTAKESDSSDARISNTGVASAVPSQDIRATTGNDPSALVDWNGAWAPGPCDWECERGGFDDGFVPDYIRDWQNTIPAAASVLVDVSAPGFLDGTCPLRDAELMLPVVYDGPTFPDIEGSEDNNKRLYQIAEHEAHNFLVTWERKQTREKKMIELSNQRHAEIANMPQEPNPFAPQIDVYLRPVEYKDVADLTIIYNHYVMNTNIPEDQEKIAIEDMSEIIRITKAEKLPFIVAVKGRMPTSNDAQGRSGSKKVIMPAVESVIGFSFSERYGYGFASRANGRSRATATLQLYVHPDYTRKGVGRNLLDRLIHCITPSYAYKNACGWINPTNDKVNESGGGGTFHQVLFQFPVEPSDDPNIGWISRFFLKFHIRESDSKKRLKAICRSSPRGNQAHFLDMAIFQHETHHEAEFDAFQ